MTLELSLPGLPAPGTPGLLVSALGSLGVFLAARSLLDRPWGRRRQERLRAITPVEGPIVASEEQEEPLFRTPLLEELLGRPLRQAGAVLAGISRLTGGPAELADRLRRAGRGDSVAAYYGQRLLFALTGAVIAALGSLLGVLPLPFWGWLAVGVLTSFVPAYGVEAALRRRHEAFQQLTPAMVDMLQTVISAGSGPEQALRTAALSMPDPLGRELREVLRRARLGETTVGEALAMLARREGLLDLGLLADLWQSAEEAGAPLGERLRELAAQLREMRRIRQREEASRATVRVLVPIAVFILVPLIVVLLFPAFYELVFRGALGGAV